MKKHIISLLVLFLLLSSSLVGVSNQVTVDTDKSETNMNSMVSPWPMYCHDTKRTARSPFAPILDGIWPEVTWKLYIDDAGTFSSPTIAEDETIYIGVRNLHKSIIAINPDGTERWQFDAGSWVESTPTIGQDGTIYFGANNGYLYALYPNGTQKWSIELGEGPVYTSPLIDEDGLIYVASTIGSTLFAIYPNATIKWAFQTSDWIYSSPAKADDGTLYIGSYDSYLYSIFPNGTLKWKYKTDGEVQSTPAIGMDGTIYFGSWDEYLYALNPNGTLQWKVHTGFIGPTSPAISSDGTIYIGDQDYHRIYCIDQKGIVLWYYQFGDDVYSSPSIDNNGIIYCGSNDGYLYALNPNGTLHWKFSLGYHIYSSPSIDTDGTIYIASWGPYVYALTIIKDSAPDKPTITGQSNGKVRKTYDYTIVSSDPEEDNISYYVDWGDGKTTEWIGPYDSSEEIIQSHIWLIRGIYEVKVKARDGHGMESDWGTLSVTMPYEPQFPFIQWLLERFPNAFPLLRYLIGFNQYL
jgi:outer membrane protein assembly factor BamB